MDSDSDFTVFKCPGTQAPGLFGWAKIAPFSFVGAVEELGFLSWELPISLFFIFSYFHFKWTYVTRKSTLNAELEGLQWRVKLHTYFHKQFNQQGIKEDGAVSGQNLLLNPLLCQKAVWKGSICVLLDPCK